jgi:hypothetical protein
MTDPNVDKLTPPPELVQHWRDQAPVGRDIWAAKRREEFIAMQASRWGADQQLEECKRYWMTHGICPEDVVRMRENLRPRPPSLKEQALDSWDRLRNEAWCQEIDFDLDLIRRALKMLPE